MIKVELELTDKEVKKLLELVHTNDEYNQFDGHSRSNLSIDVSSKVRSAVLLAKQKIEESR